MSVRNTRCLFTNLAYAGNKGKQEPYKKRYDTQQEHAQPACEITKAISCKEDGLYL